MATGGDPKPSSLADALNAFSPWGTRSSSPKPGDKEKGKGHQRKDSAASIGAQRGGDHSVSHRHRLSLLTYPDDCPRLEVQWFHAVDVPKRKQNHTGITPADTKPPAAPKKWVAFSKNDSESIEDSFQRISEDDERKDLLRQSAETAEGSVGRPSLDVSVTDKSDPSDLGGNRSLDANTGPDTSSVKVPVNEDYLFDVDIKNRELGPAYWLGPIYEVRRGSWFFIDGTILKPVDENLATQLEEGYLKAKPWKNAPSIPSDVAKSVPMEKSSSNPIPPTTEKAKDTGTSTPPVSQMTHRLFGNYMNSVVTFQDATTAWLVSDDFISKLTGTMYQRFAGGAHLSGTKVVRGYFEMKKKGIKDDKRPGTPTTSRADEEKRKRQSMDVGPLQSEEAVKAEEKPQPEPERPPETRLRTLERQMSSLVTSTLDNPAAQDEEARKRAEQEIRDDYKDTPGEAQDREIEHLVLVTHGIGQRLGARFETFNFIHDVNEFRKTLKTVYTSSGDLQAFNNEFDKLGKNSRLQVLPICWRHLLDFPKQSLKHNRKEYDLADAASEEDDQYPSLEDITVEGVPALRHIVADLVLDVLLYQSPAYKDHVSRSVVKECNRIVKLFKQRNPTFKGKVSMVGHSLGSAIMFDILSEQPREAPAFGKPTRQPTMERPELKLDFDVEHFFCFGSPIGLFQMLKGRTIQGRTNPNKVTLDGASDQIEEPFQDSIYARQVGGVTVNPRMDGVVSSPKCRQFYNIFHPTDPICYRLEPMISPVFTAMKPQNLPYIKNNFFGAPMGHGLTGIPARVGQSFSGFWSSFSSGIANNFINRSLGLSAEDAARLNAPDPANNETIARDTALEQHQLAQSLGAGTNIISGGVISAKVRREMDENDGSGKRKASADASHGFEDGGRAPTLLDNELETLYAGFQKRRKSQQDNDANNRDLGESIAWQEAEERGRKLKREEAKVRALNSNGRVDYSIQEGAFDISFLASIASHLAYWTDEDVCHFVTSQLLSQSRTVRRSQSQRSLRG